MVANQKIAKTTFSRLWVIDGVAGPTNAPSYKGQARGGALTWDLGDLTPVYSPSETEYDKFDVTDIIQGQEGLPSIPLEFRYPLAYSDMFALARRRCEITPMFHFGSCKDPRDHNSGWSDGKVLVISQGVVTTYSTGEVGALDSSQRAIIPENLAVTGRTAYEIKPVLPAIQADTQVTDEVIDVAICDSISCGGCGPASDGAQHLFALVSDSSGSPGLPAKVVYTTDGGATWATSPITSLGLAEAPSAMSCVGPYLVVVSNASISHHYLRTADLIAGLGGWTEVTTGYVGSGPPNDLVSLGADRTYIVGDGGYIYLLTDATQGVTVQEAGSVTAQDLNAIHAVDRDNVVAVGNANAVLVTTNGGSTWAAVTGPIAATVLNTVWMVTDQIWWIGAADGNVYYTIDGGDNWDAKTFQGSGTGSVADICFATREVGYLIWNDTGNLRGHAYRTIDGGYSWYRLPEQAVTWPTSRQLNAVVAATARGVENVSLWGGLAVDGSDGRLIKAA